MSSTVLFLVGAPGVGKTALARLMLGFPEVYTIVKPKWTISNDRSRCAAGHYTGDTFDGADMVPYNGAAAALDYWSRHLAEHHGLTLFDGDRFSNKGVLDGLRARRGLKVLCVHLTAPDEVLAARRAERGSNQNETWLKGRVTKAANFAGLFGGNLVLDLAALSPPDALAAKVKEFVNA